MNLYPGRQTDKYVGLWLQSCFALLRYQKPGNLLLVRLMEVVSVFFVMYSELYTRLFETLLLGGLIWED